MHTASGACPVDAPAADVWALAVSLYELLTGDLLFPGACSNLRPVMWRRTAREQRQRATLSFCAQQVCMGGRWAQVQARLTDMWPRTAIDGMMAQFPGL
jgi:serine/threonine protein kinase